MLHDILSAVSKIDQLPSWVGEIALSIFIVLALIVASIK